MNTKKSDQQELKPGTPEARAAALAEPVYAKDGSFNRRPSYQDRVKEADAAAAAAQLPAEGGAADKTGTPASAPATPTTKKRS